jgi:hypothetical protein
MIKIDYKLLNNGTAVILTRQPIVVYDEFIISALDSPPKMSISARTENISLYRELINGERIIPTNKLIGVLSVSFVVSDDAVPLKRWVGEELKIEKLKDGGVLICPNDLNLPQAVADLRVENDEIRKGYAEFKELIKKTNERIDKLYDAYKFI